MKTISILMLATILTGCAATAIPNFYNGNYYMSGDDNCKKGRSVGQKRMMCMDKDGNDTGYREAMTDQQLEMYRHNQQIQQQPTAVSSPKNTTCFPIFGGGMTCNTY